MMKIIIRDLDSICEAFSHYDEMFTIYFLFLAKLKILTALIPHSGNGENFPATSTIWVKTHVLTSTIFKTGLTGMVGFNLPAPTLDSKF